MLSHCPSSSVRTVASANSGAMPFPQLRKPAHKVSDQLYGPNSGRTSRHLEPAPTRHRLPVGAHITGRQRFPQGLMRRGPGLQSGAHQVLVSGLRLSPSGQLRFFPSVVLSRCAAICSMPPAARKAPGFGRHRCVVSLRPWPDPANRHCEQVTITSLTR
jgi:hypothetical protein